MRDDLDFLYQKAMRSNDARFINEVLNHFAGHDDEKADKLNDRLLHLVFGVWDMGYTHSDKFSFLVGDSLMGENWYRNR